MQEFLPENSKKIPKKIKNLVKFQDFSDWNKSIFSESLFSKLLVFLKFFSLSNFHDESAFDLEKSAKPPPQTNAIFFPAANTGRRGKNFDFDQRAFRIRSPIAG